MSRAASPDFSRGDDRPDGVVAGVDGCPGGWVVVYHAADSLQAEVVADLGPLVGAVRDGQVDVACIDMPIGLLEDRPRRCDIEARKVLGPRRSTVFPAPVRAALAATSYSEACELSRTASGKALSKQTFNLLDRIRRLDELLTPTDGEQLLEAHPECAFLRLAGGPLVSKHTSEGRRHRRELLEHELGEPFVELCRNSPAPLPDLLDAASLCVTGRHVVAGTAIRLGGELDATGKRAQVVY